MAWKDWGTQIRDKFLSKTVVVEARKNTVFSRMGDKETQPKHYGEDLYKYVELPIIHELNKNDKGIDANGVKLVKDKWYAYDANGAMTGDPNGYDTLHEAKAAAGADGTVLSGNGNLYGGDTDFAVIKGSFPVLAEEGGLVNRLGMTRLEVHAKVKEYGMYLDFTQKELDMTDDKNLLVKKSKALGEALAQIREKQVEIALLSESENNRIFCGNATTMAELGIGDELGLADVRNAEEYLKSVNCPYQTKIIDGSTKVDTVTVGKGYFAYVPMGFLTTLEEAKDGNNVKVFKPVEQYADAAGAISEYEVGKIRNTRFLEIPGMAIYKGMGDKVDADDDGNADAGSEKYESSTGADGNERYDIYPILYVGTDSFATIGFSGDVAKVKHKLPGEPIPGLDAYGKNGIVSVSWYFGFLAYRPERIMQLVSPALR